MKEKHRNDGHKVSLEMKDELAGIKLGPGWRELIREGILDEYQDQKLNISTLEYYINRSNIAASFKQCFFDLLQAHKITPVEYLKKLELIPQLVEEYLNMKEKHGNK